MAQYFPASLQEASIFHTNANLGRGWECDMLRQIRMPDKGRSVSFSHATKKYLRETLRLWLGINPSDEEHLPELPARLSRLFLRQEEYEQGHRDQWDNWAFSFSENFRQGRLWEPEIDIWLKQQRTELTKQGLKLEPLWPNNHPFVVCLTHDVDSLTPQWTAAARWRNLIKLLRSADLKTLSKRDKVVHLLGHVAGLLRWQRKPPKLTHTFERIIELEKKHNARSSFFFTVYPLQSTSIYDCVYTVSDEFQFHEETVTVAELTKKLIAEGFDVGLHGSYYSHDNPDLLRQQKSVLEEATGQAVTTIRQHYLRWRLPVTPKTQFSVGFTADCTHGFNRNVGFRSGVSLPFYWWDPQQEETIPILEVPLILQDGAILESYALEYDVELAKTVTGAFIDTALKNNGCVTLLFHPEHIEKQRYEALFQWSLEYCSGKNGWLASLKQIDEWWRERAVSLQVEIASK